jgi:hypothetical protein
MGRQAIAECLKCGQRFGFCLGGGFRFHLLHCDRCGRMKVIDFNRLGEIHLRYLKGLGGPYCMATAAHDEHVRTSVPVEPITGKEYRMRVEKFAGRCRRCWGLGKYRMNAPPRCPKCRSAEYAEVAGGMMYD